MAVRSLGLPWRHLMGGSLRVRVDRLPEWRSVAAGELLLDAARRGEGLSTDEVPTDVMDVLKNSDSFIVEDEADGSIVTLITVKKSPLCRSTNPEYEAGYLVVSSQYRGRGFGLEQMGIRRRLARGLGYTRTFGRTPVTARTLSPLSKLKTVFCGLIPSSMRHPDIGFVDDLIVLSQDGTDIVRSFGHPARDYTSPGYNELPELIPAAIPNPAFPGTRIGFLHDKASPVPGLSNLEVVYPSHHELLRVEQMIRSSALRGDGGFAIDEFHPNGLFDKKFFRDPTTVVFRNHGEANGSDIVAAAIFGASTVCRSVTPELACLYVIVDPLFRCEGIGKAVQMYMERYVGESGFKGVLSDIFATNKAGICMSMNAEYVVTGSLPNCGYIKGNGLTNSLLVYKRLDDWF